MDSLDVRIVRKFPYFPVILLCFALLPAGAGAETSLAGQLAQCMSIFGAVARLSCYDRVAHSVNQQGAISQQPTASSEPPAPATSVAVLPVVPAPRAAVIIAPQSQTRPEQFGSENISSPAATAGQPSRINAISSTVSTWRFTPQGRFVVTLANGQVWQQLEGDVSVPNLRGKAVRAATISRGALGSYNLSFSDQTGRFKVSRVQ